MRVLFHAPYAFLWESGVFWFTRVFVLFCLHWKCLHVNSESCIWSTRVLFALTMASWMWVWSMIHKCVLHWCKMRVLSLIHTCVVVFTLTMSSCKMQVLSLIHTCVFFFLHWQCLHVKCESGVWRTRCFHENLLGLCTAPRLRSSPSNTDSSSGISHWPSCSWRSAATLVLLSVSPHLVWCLCTHPVTLCALSCVSVHFMSRVPCVVSVCVRPVSCVPCVVSVYTLCLVHLVSCQCTLCVSCALSGVCVHLLSPTFCVSVHQVFRVPCLVSQYTLCLMYLVWCLCTPCVSCTSSCVSVHHVFCVTFPVSVCTRSVFLHLVLCLCIPSVSCTLPGVTQCLCTPCLVDVYTWCLVYLVLCLCIQCLRTPVSNLVWCLCTLPNVFVHLVLCLCTPGFSYLVWCLCTHCVSCTLSGVCTRTYPVSLYTLFYVRVHLVSCTSSGTSLCVRCVWYLVSYVCTLSLVSFIHVSYFVLFLSLIHIWRCRRWP